MSHLLVRVYASRRLYAIHERGHMPTMQRTVNLRELVTVLQSDGFPICALAPYICVKVVHLTSQFDPLPAHQCQEL